MASVLVSNTWKSEFFYDALMRRVQHKEYTWQSGAWAKTNEVRYVWSGNLMLQERSTNNSPLVTYTRGKDLSGRLDGAGGIGGLLARTDNTTSKTAFYHSDGRGNITALMSSQQYLVAKYLYDPFGNTLAAAGPLAQANTMRFSSVETHVNSGLTYNRFRYYDPNLQRFINRDPIQEFGGFNLYGYVGNNPINYVDPFGLDALTYGRLTIDIPFTTEGYEKAAQDAHEAKHRQDFLSGIPAWQKEQRGFAAEIPIWKAQIKGIEELIAWLKTKDGCRNANDHGGNVKDEIKRWQNLLGKAQQGLATAESISGDEQSAKDYWNGGKKWWQKEVK